MREFSGFNVTDVFSIILLCVPVTAKKKPKDFCAGLQCLTGELRRRSMEVHTGVTASLQSANRKTGAVYKTCTWILSLAILERKSRGS
jgi:hypothetical protein